MISLLVADRAKLKPELAGETLGWGIAGVIALLVAFAVLSAIRHATFVVIEAGIAGGITLKRRDPLPTPDAVAALSRRDLRELAQQVVTSLPSAELVAIVERTRELHAPWAEDHTEAAQTQSKHSSEVKIENPGSASQLSPENTICAHGESTTTEGPLQPRVPAPDVLVLLGSADSMTTRDSASLSPPLPLPLLAPPPTGYAHFPDDLDNIKLS